MQLALPSACLSSHRQPTSMELTTMNHAMQLHAQMLKTNYHCRTPAPTLANLFTFAALSPSAHLPYARAIFDSITDPNSYLTNSMIRAYALSQNPEQALLFFIELQAQHKGTSPEPDHFTYPFLLASCTRLQASFEGKQVHALVLKAGLHADRYIQNSLIHMYSTFKQLDCAAVVFDRMTNRDVVSWTSIINATVDADYPIEALQLFASMQDDGVAPNDATVVSVLRACADAGALSIGRRVHRIIMHKGLGSKANVVTALIDMYAKCGCIRSAEKLFDQMATKDVFAWTAMISALANHGRCKDALNLFHRMIELEIKPDERTITAVLCACRSAGWVTDGYRYYNNMHKYGMRPRIQHYGCMVDLLARAGHLNEAEGFIRRMPIEPDAVLWRTLIWASKLHGDAERGERLMREQKCLEVDLNDSGSYVLMANVYASGRKWQEKARVRELMVQRRIGRLPGCSRIEVKGVVHEFVAGDSSHQEAERIYQKLDEITEKLRMECYSPKFSEVLLDMEDEEKASQLHHHSEKLAVAFGLINTSPGEEILVVKNLRSCEDCHSAMKFVSRIYDRRIIIRDRIKFHYFDSGSCSCGDYW